MVENIGDGTPGGSDRLLRFWWKAVFRMWNRARPAPEYQMGWSDKGAARASLERILAWDFERVVLAHGDCIDTEISPAGGLGETAVEMIDLRGTTV